MWIRSIPCAWRTGRTSRMRSNPLRQPWRRRSANSEKERMSTGRISARAGDFQADGERTGAYILGGEELTLNERGESVISYADYAIAVVDEAVNGKHFRERISVVRK